MKSQAIQLSAANGGWAPLTSLAGLTVAVDMSNYMYLSMLRSQEWHADGDFDKCVAYCIGKMEMLVSFGITPYIVLDGGALPGKLSEGESRQQRRAAAETALAEHCENGGSVDDETGQKFVRRLACRTPEFTSALAIALAVRGYLYMVAPYESDAQLTYLQRCGFADVVLTHDGDLLVFGAKHVCFDTPSKRMSVDTGVYCVSLHDLVHNKTRAAESGWEDDDSGTDSEANSDDDDSNVVGGDDASNTPDSDGDSDTAAAAPAGTSWVTYGTDVHPLLDVARQSKLNFTFVYQLACLIQGSDYSPGIAGVGLKRAAAILEAAGDGSDEVAYLAKLSELCIAKWRTSSGGRPNRSAPPPQWLTVAGLRAGLDCFQHQVVFDPACARRVCSCAAGYPANSPITGLHQFDTAAQKERASAFASVAPYKTTTSASGDAAAGSLSFSKGVVIYIRTDDTNAPSVEPGGWAAFDRTGMLGKYGTVAAGAAAPLQESDGLLALTSEEAEQQSKHALAWIANHEALGEHRGSVECDGFDPKEHASGCVDATTLEVVDIPAATKQPNLGFKSGEPRYLPHTTMQIKQLLPGRDAEPSSWDAGERAAVGDVLAQYGEGHNAPREGGDAGDAARLVLAWKLLDQREAIDVDNNPALYGLDFRQNSALAGMPDLGTFDQLPANADDANDADLRAFLARFQGMKLGGRANRQDMLRIVDSIRAAAKFKAFIPRLHMDALKLAPKSNKVGVDYWLNLPLSLQPSADMNWIVDRDEAALKVPELPYSIISAKWQSELEVDGDAADNKSALVRGFRLLRGQITMSRFTVATEPGHSDDAARIFVQFQSVQSLRGKHKDAEAGDDAAYFASIILEYNAVTRITISILGGACTCVAGAGGNCAHVAALALALEQFPKTKLTRLGNVVPFVSTVHVSSTSLAKVWDTGGSGVVTGLDVPLRLMDRTSAKLGHDPEAGGTGTFTFTPTPDWFSNNPKILAHLTNDVSSDTFGGDEVCPLFLKYIAECRKDALRKYNRDHAAVSAVGKPRVVGGSARRSGGRGHVKAPKATVPGQLAVDEVLGAEQEQMGPDFVWKRQLTLFNATRTEEFRGTPAAQQVSAAIGRNSKYKYLGAHNGLDGLNL